MKEIAPCNQLNSPNRTSIAGEKHSDRRKDLIDPRGSSTHVLFVYSSGF